MRPSGQKSATFVVGLLLRTAIATITVVDTQQKFADTIDREHGMRLWHGYEYGGRLQYLAQNFALCPQPEPFPQNYTIKVPSDGRPVALLGRGGGCSVEDKAKFVLNHIEPKNVIKYLILDAGKHRGNNAAKKEIIAPKDLMEEEFISDDESIQPLREVYPLYILHVSSRTEYDLLDVLLHQSQDTRLSGGPVIAMDSRLGTGFFDGEGVIWIALAALMSACACSVFLISAGNRQGWWVDDEPPPPRPVRQPRRRLTREQVKELLPKYLYNGEGLEPLQSGDTGEAEGLIATRAPAPIDLSLCSICLEEYEAGDRLRLLPCNHTFHSRCIGKWLSERSATCPLCKTELWPDEESQEDEQEEATESPTQGTVDPRSIWDQFILYANNGENVTLELARQPPEENLVVASPPSSGSQPWWERLFSRRRANDIETSTQEMLTEPLLSSLDEEAPQEQLVHQAQDLLVAVQHEQVELATQQQDDQPPDRTCRECAPDCISNVEPAVQTQLQNVEQAHLEDASVAEVGRAMETIPEPTQPRQASV